MANAKGMMPLFVSAPRCKIKLGESVIGYAVGLSLGVTVTVEPIKTLGFYTIRSIEPLMVNPVRGTLQIVRLLHEDTRTANKKYASEHRTGFIPGAAEAAVGTEDEISSVAIGEPPSIVSTTGTSVLNQGALYRHLDMVSVLMSQSLTLDIWLKAPVIKDSNFNENGILNAGSYSLVDTFFASIKDVRLTGGSGNLSPSTIYREVFSYEGLLAVTHQDSSGNDIQQLDTTWQESPMGNG